MKYYDLCTKKTYEKNGETKTIWLKCGTMRETDDGKRFLEINHLPNTPFYLFDQKSKDQSKDQFGEVWT